MATFDRERIDQEDDVAAEREPEIDAGKAPRTAQWSAAGERPVSPAFRSRLMRAVSRDVGGPARISRWSNGDGVAADAERKVDAASTSAGRPLPDELRERFEASTGSDLSAVRVHTGSESQTAAHSVSARAYAIGTDIHFADGAYDPASSEGQRLLAHEVAHTVQQAGAAPVRQHKLEVSTPGDAAEVEADRAADAMVSGAPAMISGASTQVARGGPDPAAPAPGGATAAGPGDPPERYKTLDPLVRDLLWRSKDTYLKPAKDFWEQLDQLGAAELQTTVQTVHGAQKAGFLGCVDKIKEIYTYAGSWGLKFTGTAPPVGPPGWGLDLQYFVRKEHGDKGVANHTWYRQASGAGNPGLHCGVDAGAGDHDLHTDPTNPMEFVGKGMTSPVGWTMSIPPMPIVAPVGQAIYSASALIDHWQDIGKLPAWGKAALKPTANRPFYEIELLNGGYVGKASLMAEKEDGAMADVVDKGRAAGAIAGVRAAEIKAAQDLNAAAKPVAMQDNTGDSAPVDALRVKYDAAKTTMFNALAAFFAHCQAEAATANVHGWDNAGAYVIDGNIDSMWDAWASTNDARLDAKKKKAEADASHVPQPNGGVSGYPEDEPADGGAPAGGAQQVARDAIGPAPSKLPSSVSSVLSSESGKPLPDAQRWSSEVGADVSGARIVQGSAAAQAAADVSARAFTVGNRVFMGEGQSPSGELLRHELTHVAQQQGAPAPSSWDSLRITDPHDSVEQEARGGAAASEGAVEIARDPLDINAEAYAKLHSVRISDELNAKLDALELAITGDQATWMGDGAKGIIKKAFHYDAGYVEKIGPLIGGPAEVYRRIDHGRHVTDLSGQTVPVGSVEYSPNVATELYNALSPLLLQSFARLQPRYLYARNQAKVAADEKAQNCSKDAPEPAPGDITTSHPVDVMMRDAMCIGVIAFDWQKYQAAHPDEAKVIKKEKRELTINIDSTAPMSFWVAVTAKDGKPVTAEEVATEMFGDSAQAYRLIGTSPRFGCSAGGKGLQQVWKDQLAAHGVSKEFLDGWEHPGEDPVANLLKDPKKADEVALQQAGAQPGTGASKDDIVKRIGGNLVLVQTIAAGAKRFGLDAQLAAIQADLTKREQDLAKGDAGEAMKWDSHSAKQREVLDSLNGSMTAVVGYFSSMADTAKDPTGQKLAAEVRRLLRDATQDIVTATSQAHLIDFAAQKAVTVAQRVTTLPFDIMEALLRVIDQTIMEVASHKNGASYDPEGMKKREQELRTKISAARVQILKNPSIIQQLVEDLFDQLGDLQTEAGMASNMDALDEAIAKMADKHWQDYFVTSEPYSLGPRPKAPFEVMNEMRAQLIPWRAAWATVYADWKSGDPERKKKAKDGFKSIIGDPKYIQTLNDYQKTAQEIEEFRALVTIIATVVAAIVITLASMGVGAAVGGFASGVALGAGATAATAATIGAGVTLVTEAATMAALNTYFLSDDHSAKNFLFEFGFNLAMMGALKGIAKAYRSAAAVAKALEEGGMAGKVAVGAEMGMQGMTLNIAAIAHEKIAVYIGLKKKDPTPEELKNIFAQSTGMFIAMAIIGRVAAPLFDQLASVGGNLGGRITGMNQQRLSVFTAAMAVKSNPTPDKIADLIAKDKAELNNELEVFEMIGKDVPALEAAGIPHEQAVKIAGDAAQAAYEGKITLALQANATPISGGIYRCTVEGKAKILEAYGAEAKVENVGKDDTAKTETVLVTPKKGQPIRLVVGEKLPEGNTVDATGTTPAAPAAGAPPSLDGVPPDKADIARWQTKGITTDKPGTWSKVAADGTKFSDAYQKWISQEHPYTDNGGKLEPVKPEGVSDAAWAEFKSTFELILQKGNITLTTKGAAATQKLKDAGIDLDHLDPTSAEYAKVRPKILEILGKDALERWEASMLQHDPAQQAALEARVKEVLAGDAIAQLRAAFPDCEILLTGSISQPGKPITAVKDVDVIIIAPDNAPPEWRVAAEKRAGEMKLPTGKDFQDAKGPATLDVDAKVMTKAQYLGMRSVDPSGRNPLNDFRIDANVKTPEEIAKAKGLTDPVDIAAFKTLYEKHPGFATELVNTSPTNITRVAKMPPARLAHLESLGEVAFRHIITMPEPMFNRFTALPEATLKFFAELGGDKLARWEALDDRQFGRMAGLDVAKLQTIDAMPDADFAKATGSATTADAAYLQKVADFKHLNVDDIVDFYEKEMVFGIDHNQLIESAMTRYPTLTRAEADAIYGYTTKLFYRDLNTVLNSGGNPEAAQLSNLLKNGLASMPAAAPVQYRGLRLNSPADIAKFDADYAMNATVTVDSYWSTGPTAGDSYAGGRSLVIHTTAAKDISELAFGVHFHGLIGKPTYSSEAIIPPGVKFRVINVDTATGTVTLQQI